MKRSHPVGAGIRWLLPILVYASAFSLRAGVEEPVVFADFETSPAWQLEYRVLSGGKGSATIADLEAAPIPESYRYLYISFRAPAPTGFRVRAPEPIYFAGYVRRFEFWIFGTGRADEVYLDLTDCLGRPQRLLAGRLDFTGWRKFTVVPPPTVTQRNSVGQSGIHFRGLYLSPADTGSDGDFSLRLYADHFIAITRDHFRHPPLRWDRMKY